jgi:hypothetical protein
MDYLSLYELEQTHAIARWKSELPSFLHAVAALCKPLPYRAIDRAVVSRAVEQLTNSGNQSLGRAEVEQLASTSDVAQLRYSPLRDCDRLAARITTRFRRNLPTAFQPSSPIPSDGTAPSAPPLLIATLQLVCRIGYCYGYRMDTPQDRDLLLTILDHANQPEQRAHVTQPEPARHFRLLAGETSQPAYTPLQQTSQDLANNTVNNGLVLDYGLLNRAAESARRVFQEQWLIDNGKSDIIPPAAARHRRSALDDLGRAMGHAAYVLGGAIGFGAVYPVVALSRIFTHGDRPAARGARDGAQAAARHADQLVSGLAGQDTNIADPLPVPTLRIMIG